MWQKVKDTTPYIGLLCALPFMPFVMHLVGSLVLLGIPLIYTCLTTGPDGTRNAVLSALSGYKAGLPWAAGVAFLCFLYGAISITWHESRSKDAHKSLSATMNFLASMVLFATPYIHGSDDFYQYVKLFMMAVMAVGIVRAYQSNNVIPAFIYGIISVLFNPFLPIHFSKNLWSGIYILTGLVLFFGATLFEINKESV